MRSSAVIATAAFVAAPLVAAYPGPASADGSEAVSLGNVLNLGKDGYNAYEAVKGAYDSFTGKSKRDELVGILAREIHDQLLSHEHPEHLKHADGHGRKYHHKGHKAHQHKLQGEHKHDEEHKTAEAHKPRHIGQFIDDSTILPAVDRRGRIDDIDKGVNIATDAANAASAVHNAWDSWHHRRGRIENFEKGVHIASDISNIASNFRREPALEYLLTRSLFDELD